MVVSVVLELTDKGSNNMDDIHIIAGFDSHLVDDCCYKFKYTRPTSPTAAVYLDRIQFLSCSLACHTPDDIFLGRKTVDQPYF